MIKLLAVVLAVVLLLNYTVGRNIEIVPDQNENTIFEFEGVDMKIQDGSIDKIVISRFGLHVESMTPYTNLNGIISYTIGARVRGLLFMFLCVLSGCDLFTGHHNFPF